MTRPRAQEVGGPASPEARRAAGTSETVGRLERVMDGWRALGAQSGGPIEQPEWAAACLDANPAAGRLRVFAVRRGDRLVAIAPMVAKSVRGVTRTVMLGVDSQHEPMDLLAADPEALEALARSLARDSRPSVFGRLPADSASVAALRTAFRGHALIVARPRAPFPHIALDESWIEPESHLSPRRRSDLRRAGRRAEQLGEVRADLLAPEPRDVDSLLDEAFRVEASSWKGASGTAIAFDPPKEAFIRSFARRASERGSLRLSFLRIDGRAVAMQIAVVQGGGYWLLKIGYDEEFARCSPGILLLRESIASAARLGLSSFEFLGASESWIAPWTERERGTVCISAYPLGLRGAAALVVDTLDRAWRPGVRRSATVRARLRTGAVAAATAALGRVGRRYVVGPSIQDAHDAAERAAVRGMAAVLGFWDGPDESPREVADQYLEAIDALATDRRDTFVAVKLPALGLRPELLAPVAAQAAATGRRLHVNSLAIEAADDTREMVERVREAVPDLEVGVTLPGRWRRSLDDVAWVREHGLPVRVVKGEWPDPDDADRDKKEGFLEVIDRLAGCANHVGVATHDTALAREAVQRLRSAGTPCDLERALRAADARLAAPGRGAGARRTPLRPLRARLRSVRAQPGAP